MYNLFYWAHQPKLMCTFRNYTECQLALTALKNKYPKAEIWYEPVVTINCYDEWVDKFNTEIKEYENN